MKKRTNRRKGEKASKWTRKIAAETFGPIRLWTRERKGRLRRLTDEINRQIGDAIGVTFDRRQVDGWIREKGNNEPRYTIGAAIVTAFEKLKAQPDPEPVKNE